MRLGSLHGLSARVNPKGRRDPLRSLFIIGAGAAGAVTAWALAWPLPEIRAEIPRPQQVLREAPLPAQPSAEPEIRVADLMMRPLFRRDRSPGLPPPAEPEPEAKPEAKQQEAEIAANRRAALQRYRLSGTVVTDDYQVAVIARAGDPKMLLVREGDDLEGWTVGEIARRSVTLKSGDETAELVFPAPRSPEGPLQVTATVPGR